MRVQARVELPEVLRSRIDAMRLRWNPEEATGNPAHLTVVYHDEVSDPELLRARLEQACKQLSSFTVQLGKTARFEAPVCGAFLEVLDPSGGVALLRRAVLQPPSTPRQRFGLHVTLLHPRQGQRLAQAWPELSSFDAESSFRVERVELICGSGSMTRTLVSLPLDGSQHSTRA